eukprot:6196176-Pyramimonas_sp.AAC.1
MVAAEAALAPVAHPVERVAGCDGAVSEAEAVRRRGKVAPLLPIDSRHGRAGLAMLREGGRPGLVAHRLDICAV